MNQWLEIAGWAVVVASILSRACGEDERTRWWLSVSLTAVLAVGLVKYLVLEVDLNSMLALPWWWYAMLVVGTGSLASAIKFNGQRRYGLGFSLLVGCLFIQIFPPDMWQLSYDKDAENVFARQMHRLDALGIHDVRLSCDAKTKTLVGEFSVGNSEFDQDAVSQSKTACSQEGILVMAWRGSNEFLVKTRERYKTSLLVGELDRMLNAQFGGLYYGPELTGELDKQVDARLDAAQADAIRFLCVQGVFQYEVVGYDGTRRGTTAIACPEPVDGQPAQLRIRVKPTFPRSLYKPSFPGALFRADTDFAHSYALATKSMTVPLTRALLDAALGDPHSDGRKDSF